MENKKNKDDLQKAVHSKIKGLGLDALFHQVDKGAKDELSYTLRKKPKTQEEIRLIEKLKNPPPFSKHKNIFSLSADKISTIFSKNKNNHLIIDIGTSMIKIMEIKNDKSSLSLEKASCIPIPHIITTTKEKLDEFIIQSLKNNLDLRSLRSKIVSAFIPRNKVMVKFLAIPTIEPGELKKMLEFEAEHHLPFALSDLEYDFHIIKQKNNQTYILFAAVKKEEISEILHLFDRAAININLITVSSLAVYNCLLKDPLDGVSMQILIGAKYTDINIVSDGQLEFSRGIKLGSKALTFDLSEKLNLDFENAEKIKKENGISLKEKDKNETQKNISLISSSWADKLIAQIKRSIQHFQLHTQNQEINRVILTGGGSKLENLNEYLRDKLKIKTIISKKLNELKINCDPSDYNKYFQEFSIPLGLAFGLFNKAYITINLLPQNLKTSLKRRKRLTNLYIKAGLFGLVLILALSIPFGLAFRRDNRIKKMEQNLDSLKPEIKKVRELKNKILTIEDYISIKQSSLGLMREISLLVTDDIIINRFSFERNIRVNLTGTAQTHSSAVNFSQSLAESEFFESANLKYTQKKDRYTEDVDFEIICTLKNNNYVKP